MAEIKEPSQDIILLGAGASMAAGFPSAAGLSRHLETARQKLEALSVSEAIVEKVGRDIQWLRDVQKRLGEVSSRLIGLNPENIEDVFRIWGHEEKSSSPPPDAPEVLIPGYQYPRLIRMMAIALAYSPRFPSVKEFDNSSVYAWLISKIADSSRKRSEREVIIITTNYDLVLEFAVASNSEVDLNYTYTERSGLQHLFGRSRSAHCTLRYLKLHGSVNWWGQRPDSKVSRDSARSMVESPSPLAEVAKRYEVAGRDIEMVPPAILKDIIFRSNWTEVWEQAYSAFCRCRTLTIIGYSFSPGDILVQQMATLGLARSPFLKSISVIDPNAGDVAANLSSYFHSTFNSEIEWQTFHKRFDDNTPNWIPDDII